VLAGILYVVSTPIGNLKDITIRALEILQQVDLIAAEDARHTNILLKHHEISKRMIRYHEHNEERRAQELLSFLEGRKELVKKSIILASFWGSMNH